jgi:ABC-2 type transport system permease protein
MLKSAWQSFRVSAWLGWQIESNWTDPFLFFIYSVLKPIASVLILVAMYLIISQSATTEPLFAYIYLGNAFYIYVGSVTTGVSWAVIDDREHYGTLKYIYRSPIPYMTYLLGRGVARLITGTIAVVITLAFGVLALRLPIRFDALDAPLFLVSLTLGLLGLAFIGLFLGGATMLMVRHAWHVGDAVAGALYLFSGAIFPLSVLPPALQPIGYGLPMTYWLELLRRSLLGPGAAAFPTFASYTSTQLLAILTGLTILYGVVALMFFRWAENRAREKGLLDLETHY